MVGSLVHSVQMDDTQILVGRFAQAASKYNNLLALPNGDHAFFSDRDLTYLSRLATPFCTSYQRRKTDSRHP